MTVHWNWTEIQLTLITVPPTPTRTTVTFKIIHFVNTLSSMLTQRGCTIINIYRQRNIYYIAPKCYTRNKEMTTVKCANCCHCTHVAFVDLELKQIFEVVDKSIRHILSDHCSWSPITNIRSQNFLAHISHHYVNNIYLLNVVSCDTDCGTLYNNTLFEHACRCD